MQSGIQQKRAVFNDTAVVSQETASHLKGMMTEAPTFRTPSGQEKKKKLFYCTYSYRLSIIKECSCFGR
jgi:hypothetical protein